MVSGDLSFNLVLCFHPNQIMLIHFHPITDRVPIKFAILISLLSRSGMLLQIEVRNQNVIEFAI